MYRKNLRETTRFAEVFAKQPDFQLGNQLCSSIQASTLVLAMQVMVSST